MGCTSLKRLMLLVYGLVRAPIEGWGSARTIGVLAGAAAVLAAFVLNEVRHRAPLAPLSIFRINGLGYANVTQLVAFAGFLALFFYVTLYMQNVLGYSAIQTGLAYLPLCGIAVVGAGVSSQLFARIGTRPVIIAGAAIGAGGLFWLSRIPVGGSYVADLLPGLLLVGLGIAGLFVAVATAANAGVPADKAGLAAALLNASQWLILSKQKASPSPPSSSKSRPARAPTLSTAALNSPQRWPRAGQSDVRS